MLMRCWAALAGSAVDAGSRILVYKMRTKKDKKGHTFEDESVDSKSTDVPAPPYLLCAGVHGMFYFVHNY